MSSETDCHVLPRSSMVHSWPALGLMQWFGFLSYLRNISKSFASVGFLSPTYNYKTNPLLQGKNYWCFLSNVISVYHRLYLYLGRIVFKAAFFLPSSQATLHTAVGLTFLKHHSHCATQNTLVVPGGPGSRARPCGTGSPQSSSTIRLLSSLLAHWSPRLRYCKSLAVLSPCLPHAPNYFSPPRPLQPSRIYSKSLLSKPVTVLSCNGPVPTHLSLFFRQIAVWFKKGQIFVW